jgi:hypothetical protein
MEPTITVSSGASLKGTIYAALLFFLHSLQYLIFTEFLLMFCFPLQHNKYKAFTNSNCNVYLFCCSMKSC